MAKEIKLISAKKAKANVANYYDAEVLQEENNFSEVICNQGTVHSPLFL